MSIEAFRFVSIGGLQHAPQSYKMTVNRDAPIHFDTERQDRNRKTRIQRIIFSTQAISRGRKITMKVLQKTLCTILVLIMMETATMTATPVLAEGNTPPLAPTGLMIDQSNEPLGVENTSPVFSWIVNDADSNERQSAYQILIATSAERLNEDEADIWNSGKVLSSESSNAVYGGGALPANGKYYWTVRTWDKDGEAGGYAEPQFFTTAVKDEWNASAIWAAPNRSTEAASFADQGFTDYTIECDFSITSSALGLILRKPTATYAEDQEYMLQINTASQLRMHVFFSAGSYRVLDPVDLTQFGIAIQANTDYHLKVTADGSTVRVAINDIEAACYTLTDYSSGTFGFRCGLNESGSVKNLSVKGSDGTLLYADRFADGYNPFSAGSVQDGAFFISGEAAAVYGAADSVYAAGGYTDYIYESDFVITDTAVAFCIRHTSTKNTQSNMYMIQVNTSSQFRPHVADSYPTLIGDACLDLRTLGITINANETHHIKIAAVGRFLQTWIDGIFVSQIESNQFRSGTFGLRCGGGESGYVDNIRVSKPDGAVLFEEDFSDGLNPFLGGESENGHLTVRADECFYYDTYQDNVVFLRREFRISKTVDKAIVSAIGKDPDAIHGYTFKLYMNGELFGIGSPRGLGDGVYTNVYSTFDATELIRNGGNCIGAICYTTGSDKRLQLQMKIYYTDGTTETLVTDSGWKGIEGTKIYGDNGTGLGGTVYIMSENMDARAFPYGWNEPGFDDSAWRSAATKETISDLIASPIENMSTYDMPAAEIVNKGNGNYFIKLEKAIIGSLRLALPGGTEGNRITVLYGEQATDDYSAVWQTLALNQYREYWTMRDGAQVFEGWGIKSFRYVELQNCPVEITADMVTGVAVRQSFAEDDSFFYSSDQVLNDVWELCKYTIEATNQDMYVDSQTRERLNYGGDTYINQLSSYSVSRSYQLARYSTAWALINPTWPTEYTMLNILGAWEDYLYTGNRNYIETYYDRIKAALLEERIDSTGLYTSNVQGWNSDMIDWPVNVRDGYNVSDCYYNTVINCYEYAALNAVTKMAELLGKDGDAAHYTAAAESLRNAINTHFYNTLGDGLYIEGMKSDGTPVTGHAIATSIYPLLFGVADDSSRQKLADTIVQAGMKGGIYTAQFQLQALYAQGCSQAALALMSATDLTSWGNMIYNLDCTITCEAFDPSINNCVSFSHPWSTAPSNNIVRGMFGIVPLEKAFDKLQIKPQTGSLCFAELTAPTIKGAVSVSVSTTRPGFAYSMETVTPANTTATVYVPISGAEHNTVLVDGVAVTAQAEDGWFVLDNIGSGVHTFQVPQEAVIPGDVNADRTVDIRDLVSLKKAVVSQKFTAVGQADVNGDSTVDAGDLTALRKMLLGKEKA